MGEQFRQRLLLGGAIAILSVLAACAPKAPPPPPPPPPPKPVVYIPPRPRPPISAPAGVAVPPLGANGVRQTVNANLSPTQATWNFRSAYNVAALNCLKPEHADILVGYRAFLKSHARGLKVMRRFAKCIVLTSIRTILTRYNDWTKTSYCAIDSRL